MLSSLCHIAVRTTSIYAKMKPHITLQFVDVEKIIIHKYLSCTRIRNEEENTFGTKVEWNKHVKNISTLSK